MIRITRFVAHYFHPTWPSSVTLIAVPVIVFTLLGVTARAWLVKQPIRETKPAMIRSTPPRIEVELLVLTPEGFSSAEIKRPAGSFLLAVDNHTNPHEELTLSLRNAEGDRMYEFKVSSKKPRLRKLIDLRPGQYWLTVINHPELISKFTVTDQ